MHKRILDHKIRLHGRDILEKDTYQKNKEYVHHGKITLWDHSIHVTRISLLWSMYLPVRFSEKDLIRGALLHDYFLYDWHDLPVGWKEIKQFYKMHGFVHAAIAHRNARRDFVLTKIQQDIIKKHMWPLTVVPPMTREAWLVTAADKYCSAVETLFCRQKGDG